ncbi:FILAMENT-LIKE PLANT PROTEIN 7 [Salix viminalis]|uniref:FILAMENT-LIKE PLANT PROTEIN 7 n=1 Tax=Salix viminalis TaxID=40686 RepID=A0A9Q0SIL7_SALVM|nr:FILAMENT-LIKE PLANT PROTEIN 7 [Salix viminalis]
MDHKTWMRRKKSADKIAVATDHKVDLSSNEEEIQTLLADKAELENDLKNLSGKLSSALSECNAKDDLAKKQAKLAKEAMAGLEKAEAKAVSLKQELDEALQERAAGEHRSTRLDAALKECMQQLRFVREDQERRIHDAVMKTTNEFEKSQMILEEKLAETSSSPQKKIVLLSNTKSECSRKEVEIRNKESEFNLRTADVSRKQHLESVKRVAKLEADCQRLRVLVRKRLPGPASLAKMKSEVEILGRDSVEISRRSLDGRPVGLMVDSAVENSADSPRKRISFLAEQLCVVEEENKILKEAFNKKANELQFSRSMYARTASKLSQVESRLVELSKGQTTLERTKSVVTPHEMSLASMSEIGSDDRVSSAESWASALISELEHCKQGKQRGSPTKRTIAASDISMMDDFAEMEKLAIVSVEEQFEGPRVSSEGVNATGPDKSRLQIQSGLSKSLCKIIDLIERITLSLADDGNSQTLTRKDGSFFPCENTETPSDYMVCVLQWKNSELIAVLQQFVHACYDLLNGKSDVSMFAQELCSALDWTMNRCFSIQDKKHFDWDESRSGCKAESVASNGHHNYFEKDGCHQSTIRDENKTLREDLINTDSEKRDLQARLQSATNNSESLMNQLKESKKIIGSLQTDLETVRDLKAKFESQDENHKLTKEDVDPQLTVARVELNEAHRKLSSLEMELENKRSCCEDLEAACLELQLQLESMTKKEIPTSELHQEESHLRTLPPSLSKANLHMGSVDSSSTFSSLGKKEIFDLYFINFFFSRKKGDIRSLLHLKTNLSSFS